MFTPISKSSRELSVTSHHFIQFCQSNITFPPILECAAMFALSKRRQVAAVVAALRQRRSWRLAANAGHRPTLQRFRTYGTGGFSFRALASSASSSARAAMMASQSTSGFICFKQAISSNAGMGWPGFNSKMQGPGI